MADNTVIPAGVEGDTLATDELTTLNGSASSGVRVFRDKVGFGAAGSLRDADASNGVPSKIVAIASVSLSGDIAAGATGTIGPLDISAFGNISFIIKNQVAANPFAGSPVVVFEQSDDGTSWAPLMVKHDATGGLGSTWILDPNAADTEIVFDGSLQAVTQVRVRVTTGPATNAMTVVIRAAVMPFVPHVATTNRHNTGRTPWSWFTDAGVNSTSETAVSMTAATVVGTNGVAANAYSVPAGKTLRIQCATFSVWMSNTTLVIVRFRLRATASGTATNASPLFLSFPRFSSQTTSVTNNMRPGSLTIEFFDGIEFAAGNSICLTALLNTNGATAEALLAGHLY